MSSTVSKLADKIQSPTLEAFGHALAGASAGAFALSVLYPLDQIKVPLPHLFRLNVRR